MMKGDRPTSEPLVSDLLSDQIEGRWSRALKLGGMWLKLR